MNFGRPLLLDAEEDASYGMSNNNMDQFSAAQFQQMMAAMASAKISSSSSASKHNEDEALSSLFRGQQDAKASASLLNDLSTPEASGFMTLIKNTDVSNQLAAAAANGQSVTIFAPDNKAMAKMPNNAAKKMAQSENRTARNAFAKQHAAIDFEGKMAQAQMGGLGNHSVAFSTVNSKRHVGLERNDEGHLMANLYDNEGELVASARVTKTISDEVNGHKLHVLDSALQQ